MTSGLNATLITSGGLCALQRRGFLRENHYGWYTDGKDISKVHFSTKRRAVDAHSPLISGDSVLLLLIVIAAGSHGGDSRENLTWSSRM